MRRAKSGAVTHLQGSRLETWDLGLKVQGLGCRIQGLGFRVSGVGSMSIMKIPDSLEGLHWDPCPKKASYILEIYGFYDDYSYRVPHPRIAWGATLNPNAQKTKTLKP